MRVSVLTPTIRPDGLPIVAKALADQSFRDLEWLIGSPFDPGISKATWVKDDFSGGFWSLNRIYNKLFKVARGDLFISWQDWIWAPPDALERFVGNYRVYPGVISGVGDQYERINKWGKPEVKIWSDPRKRLDQGSFYECTPEDAEWNWCLLPKKDIFAVGGMDEGLDWLGFGGDQLQINERLDVIGTRFYLDQTNESFTVRHGRENFGGQENWDKNHVLFNGKYQERLEELKKTGKFPCVGYI